MRGYCLSESSAIPRAKSGQMRRRAKALRNLRPVVMEIQHQSLRLDILSVSPSEGSNPFPRTIFIYHWTNARKVYKLNLTRRILGKWCNMIKSTRRNSNSRPDLAEFLGWHVGDGCISINKRYSEYALAGDISEEYPFYKNIITPAFNSIFKHRLKKQVVLKKYESVGVCGIYVFDKDFVSNLQKEYGLISGKKINIQIPRILKTINQKKQFLRGLFDTDGSIYFCKSNVKTKKDSVYTVFHYKPKIKLATISKRLINQVYKMLSDLGFTPRLYSPRKQKKNENFMYPVVLDTKKDTKKWIQEIGFRSAKHLTKIEVWNKFGFCPPYTKLQERTMILKGKLNPLSFYPQYKDLSLKYVKNRLGS